MDIANDFVKQLLGLGPELLLGAGIIVLGYILKWLPAFPDKAIPGACVLLGMVLYPLMTPPGRMAPDVRYPVVREVMLGLLVGFCAWIAHNKGLKKLEDKVPWLRGLLSNEPSKPETNGGLGRSYTPTDDLPRSIIPPQQAGGSRGPAPEDFRPLPDPDKKP